MKAVIIGFLSLCLVAYSGIPGARADQSGNVQQSKPAEAPSPLTADELYIYVEGVTIAILLHEVGHAAIDVYNLPVIGQEEDAADEFATIFLFEQAVSKAGRNSLALSFFDFFHTYVRQKQRDKGGQLKTIAYWDTHDLAERRAFNVLCDMYGGFAKMAEQNPQAQDRRLAIYAEILRDLGASDARLQRCADVFERNLASWNGMLKPWFRDPREAQKLLDRMAEGSGDDASVTPGFRVTYAPSGDRRPPSVSLSRYEQIYDNERLRYHLPAQIARLLSARFKPPQVGGGGYSIDIISRSCGRANAFYTPDLRTITLCHELLDAIADAYIRYRTGMEPVDWWQQFILRAYQPGERAITGLWSAEDGSTLRLEQGGLFTIRGGREHLSPRKGHWGLKGDKIWLIETWRMGSDCYNPACRPGLSADGLSPQERKSLRYGGIPRGGIRGNFHVPPCRQEEVRREIDRSLREIKQRIVPHTLQGTLQGQFTVQVPGPEDLLKLTPAPRLRAATPADASLPAASPCDGKEPSAKISTIDIDGTIFSHDWKSRGKDDTQDTKHYLTLDGLFPDIKDDLLTLPAKKP